MAHKRSEKAAEWFEMVEHVIHEYDIKMENIYNLDKTGFSIGSTQAS